MGEKEPCSLAFGKSIVEGREKKIALLQLIFIFYTLIYPDFNDTCILAGVDLKVNARSRCSMGLTPKKVSNFSLAYLPCFMSLHNSLFSYGSTD